MSQAMAAEIPAAAATSAHLGVRHIWLPSQRSLCELAVRQVATSTAGAEELNAASRNLPGCEACVVVTEMLANSATILRTGGTAPSRDEALRQLTGTTWPWVSSILASKEGPSS
jgi:hypothetical protein